jgi:hypothetical protein
VRGKSTTMLRRPFTPAACAHGSATPSHFGNSGGNDGRTAVISTFKHLANDRQTEKALSLSNVYKVVKKSQYFNVYTQ